MSDEKKTEDSKDDGSIPPSLQKLLAHLGVLSSATGAAPALFENDVDEASHSWMDVVFESTFDLTEERLRFVFDRLDIDGDGRISYDSLRRGLEMHSSLSSDESHTAPMNPRGLHLTQESFDRLVEFLDMDRSQDITFPEFSQGLRYIMLRALFSSNHRNVQAVIEVLDYDEHHLERRFVVNDHDPALDLRAPSSKSISSTARASLPISMTEFYFQDRPDWVQTRWINVSGAQSPLTLKRLAVRYMLHPLALEDALSPSTHRPKAEVYSSRKSRSKRFIASKS